MSARHARADEDVVVPGAVLHLVDDDPRDAQFAPEVRAVLDAVALLHSAVISWAAATTGDAGPRHTAAPTSGRHRR